MRTSSVVASLLWLFACSKEPASMRIKLTGEAVNPKAKGEAMAPVLREKGMTLALRAGAYDADGIYRGPLKATWMSSNAEVVTVDGEGDVTAVGSGVATITAASVGTKAQLTANMDVRVSIVEQVKIVPPPEFTKIRLGQAVQLKAEVTDDRGQPVGDVKVHWEAPDHGVWVSPTGEIEGAVIGETTVTAEAAGRTAALKVEVLDRR